jgi:hypothetical protein
VLARLVPYLPPPLIDQVLEAVRAIHEAEQRSRALALLAPRLTELGRHADLLEVAREISARRWRAGALAALASCWQGPNRVEVLREALEAVMSLPVEGQPNEALSQIGLHLADLPAAQLYPLWTALLNGLLSRTRKELCVCLLALRPVLVVIGGEKAATETLQALRDVGRWWP